MADQAGNITQVLRIQALWARFHPSGPRVLRDPQLLLGMFYNESTFGHIHGGGTYRGFFQHTTRVDTDRRGRTRHYGFLSHRSSQQAVADQLNRMGEHDPEVMRVSGRIIPRWTADLVRRHYEHNPYIQTVATLEFASRNLRDPHLRAAVETLSPQHAAALTYMAHVVPALARLMAQQINRDVNSGRSLLDLVGDNRQLRRYIRANPSVFNGGRHSPLATLDRWLEDRMDSAHELAAELIPSPIGVASIPAPVRAIRPQRLASAP